MISYPRWLQSVILLFIIFFAAHTPPTVVLPPSVQSKYDANVTLDCKVKGYPTPTIQWYFNGVSQLSNVVAFDMKIVKLKLFPSIQNGL